MPGAVFQILRRTREGNRPVRNGSQVPDRGQFAALLTGWPDGGKRAIKPLAQTADPTQNKINKAEFDQG